VIPSVRVIDLGDGIRPLSLMIEERPRATIFRGWRRFPLSASVCATCGYTELYVEDPASMREAHARAQATSGLISPDVGIQGALPSARVFIALALGLALLAGLGIMLLYLFLIR
jgi:hypothetical protein